MDRSWAWRVSLEQLETVVINRQLIRAVNGLRLLYGKPLALLLCKRLGGANPIQLGSRILVCQEIPVILGELRLHPLFTSDSIHDPSSVTTWRSVFRSHSSSSMSNRSAVVSSFNRLAVPKISPLCGLRWPPSDDHRAKKVRLLLRSKSVTVSAFVKALLRAAPTLPCKSRPPIILAASSQPSSATMIDLVHVERSGMKLF